MLVIKRKNIVIGLLVALLVITGYLNFIYNQKSIMTINGDEQPKDSVGEVNGDVSVDDVVDDDERAVSQQGDGEAVETGGSSFFRDYRFEREKTRNEEIDYIKTIVDNPGSDQDMINEAQSQLLRITDNMEKEMAIEGLIKSKNFKDAVVIIHENNVSVIVDKPELESEEVAQILDIVMRESGESPENIQIIPKL